MSIRQMRLTGGLQPGVTGSGFTVCVASCAEKLVTGDALLGCCGVDGGAEAQLATVLEQTLLLTCTERFLACSAEGAACSTVNLPVPMFDSAVEVDGSAAVTPLSAIMLAIRSAAGPATEALLLRACPLFELANAVVETSDAAGATVLSERQLSAWALLACATLAALLPRSGSCHRLLIELPLTC